MKTISTITAALLLSACQQLGPWEKPSATMAQKQKDYGECLYDAAKVRATENASIYTMGAGTQVEAACMTMKGYSRQTL